MRPHAVVAALALALAPAARAEPPILTRTLPNGLEVLVVEVPGSPLVTVEVAVRNGSMTEPPDYNGLSHLYEHMFFKANAVLPDQEAYLARARELGLSWNGSTNTERVNYFFSTTADHLADAMAFMRDAVVSPRFDPGELDKERVVVTGEIDRNEANPRYHLFHETSRRVWWRYPSRKDPLGNRATVLRTTVGQLRTIQRRYYVPNNAALLVTGGVRADQVFAMAGELYRGWKPSPRSPFADHPLVKHPPLRRTELVLVEQPVRTVWGSFTWHGPSTVGKDVDLTYAADVQSMVLDQPASRFQKALVDSGLCLRVGMIWFTQMNTGPITLGFDATPERAADCIRAVQAELPRMLEPGYLSAEELRDAVLRLEVQRALENEQPSDLAHTLSFWWTSAGIDYYRTYLDRLRKVTEADVVRYLRAYVLDRPYVLSVMVSREMAASHGLGRRELSALAATVKAPPARKEAGR